MKTVCDLNSCTGCRACVEICTKNAVSIVDTMRDLNAFIDEEKCIKCGACARVCQSVHPLELHHPIKWVQGWCLDDSSRAKSSSGGFAFHLMKQFIEDGGVVCSCVFEGGHFLYRVAKTVGHLDAFRGSKYVKSDTKSVYTEIKKLLIDRYRVLFIGLPCHVAGLKCFVGEKFRDLLVTVDLVCHGSPSQGLLVKYLAEKHISIDSVNSISFRNKTQFRVAVNRGEQDSEIALTPPGVRDRYTIGFLSGLFYTENCYSCRYARLERVSDITIGDSWGSELEITPEGPKGISLALCQSERGISLLNESGLNLLPVDLKRAVEANHQLMEPSKRPAERELFFKKISEGKSIHAAIKMCYHKICVRQDMKAVLSKLHLINR